ncbi:MAG: hypothetical protein MUC29_12350, partial [Pyrinomonadaceae bacterium]|nr:hypothetical protein [Pyrinomonadaceae bacterium]
KNVKCPSSEKLLAFQKDELFGKEKLMIGKHLADCEFCASELELYEHYPQSDETIVASDIPLPLYQLAEALLSTGQKRFSILNNLLNENENLSLNKA